MVVPEECIAAILEPGVKFKCTSCHWKQTVKSAPLPYFVSVRFVQDCTTDA